MIEDKPIDYKTEYNKTINKLVSLRQKHDGLKEDHDYIKSLADRYFDERIKLKKENEQLKQSIKEVLKLLEEEVDLFSDKATEHEINAYIELRELDNKDAYYMAISTKKAIKLLKEMMK